MRVDNPALIHETASPVDLELPLRGPMRVNKFNPNLNILVEVDLELPLRGPMREPLDENSHPATQPSVDGNQEREDHP